MCLGAFGNYWVYVNEKLLLGFLPALLNVANDHFSQYKRSHQQGSNTLREQIVLDLILS